MRRAIAAALSLLTLSAAGACGGSDAPEGTAGKAIAPLPSSALPGEILDLQVVAEDVKPSLSTAGNTYVSGAGLYSLRRDDIVQATLQVMRFNDAARLDDPGFRRSMVTRVGGATPEVVRLGSDEVYFSRGIKQRLSVWYREPYMFVLSTRDDYEKPRTLLRTALDITPEEER